MCKGIALALVIGLMVVSMSNAVDPNVLPADVKQWLVESWRVVPDARPYDVRAIQALTPDRAAAAVQFTRQYLRQVPRSTLYQLAATVHSIRRALLPSQQQPFINGAWGVSRQESQFFNTVVNTWASRQQSFPLYGGGGSQGSLPSIREWNRDRENYLCSWQSTFSFCRR